MKRTLGLLLSLMLLLVPLAGCAKKEEAVELRVFAAASMQETLTAVAEQYKSVAPNVTLTFTFDSSGTLKTQIEEGAECDLFISAAPKQMNALEEGGLIDAATRVDLLENKVVLVAAERNPADLTSFDDLAEKLQSGGILLAMGNSDVPVGQYTQKIFDYYGLDEAALAAAGVLTYGSNVKEVMTQVVEMAVDCGIVYATDAAAEIAPLPIIDEATAEMCGQVIYPAAVLSGSAHAAEAKAFLDYLKGADAAAIFEAVGFTSLTK